MNENDIIAELYKIKNDKLVEHHQKFFKTFEGGYGEGDLFLGLTAPQIRGIIKKYKNIDYNTIKGLLQNKYHEARLFVLYFLTDKAKKCKNVDDLETVAKLYIKNVKYINNWDLVDISCPYIIGKYCFLKGNDDIIYNFSDCKYNTTSNKLTNLWCERISVVSCMYLIKNGQFGTILELCDKFLNHKHDLIHKACGWMLREVGKKNMQTLYTYLDKNYYKMPRTMLRYSVEKLSKNKQKIYMARY